MLLIPKSKHITITKLSTNFHCVISGSSCEVDENFLILDELKKGEMGFPETSTRNYTTTRCVISQKSFKLVMFGSIPLCVYNNRMYVSVKTQQLTL
jgi:hypothetical protein